MEKAYKNLGYFLLILIPLTFIGFYSTYFSQVSNFPENITGFVHLHALIASIWIAILIIQPILIRNRKNNLHKKIGKISYVIFPLLILSSVPQILRIIDSGVIKNIFFPVSDGIALILFYSLAIYFRKKVTYHMRFIIGTAIVFLGPTFGRIGIFIFEWSEMLTQNVQYAITYVILISVILLDKRDSNKIKPYLFIIGVYIVHQAVFNLMF